MKRQSIQALAATALLLASATAAFAVKPVPAELQPPSDEKMLFEAHASGVQIYVSQIDAGGAPKWVLEAPLAELTAPDGKLVVHHYAGPSWEADDGSKVSKGEGGKVVSVKAPSSASDIPWLLIKVTPDHASGVLSKVDYVQRIFTSGGAAPSTPPTRPGTKIGVPYSATYVFYGSAG